MELLKLVGRKEKSMHKIKANRVFLKKEEHVVDGGIITLIRENAHVMQFFKYYTHFGKFQQVGIFVFYKGLEIIKTLGF